MTNSDRSPEEPLNVAAIMSAQPVTVDPVTPVREVVRLMGERNIGAVVVVDGGAPVGIFTERDVLRQLDRVDMESSVQSVSEFMTPAPWTVEPGTPWQAALDVMQQRHIRHAPVVDGGMVVGMLSVRDIMRHRVALLESAVQQRTAEMARQNAVVAERDAERTHSLKIAGRIQRQFLPDRPPEFDPLSIAFAFHSLEQVAGDYFDVQFADPDTMVLLIGDASGHGIAAAFISVMARTCVHARLSGTDSPAAILRALNELLHGWVEPEHFISMFVAAIDRRTLKMTFARAGHPLPLLFRAGGEVLPLDAGGIMIGVLPDPDFPQQTVQLRRRDRVLFYTDGLVECPGAGGELFGIERAQEFVQSNHDLRAAALVSKLVDRVRQHSETGRFADDLTVALLDVQ